MSKTAITTFFTLWLVCGSHSFAQPISAEQASKETHIEGLRLLPYEAGVNFGYVEKDTKLGKYLCGGMTVDEASSSSNLVSHTLEFTLGHELGKGRPKYIILCSQVLASGQRVGGIPVPPINLLMLDASASAEHIEHTVLHELFHLIEYRFNSFNDVEWQHRFGGGYANTYKGYLKNAPIGSGKDGFANSYSETFPHEERAELFAFLILQPEGLASQMDDELSEKVQFIVDKCNKLFNWNILW